MGNSRILLPRTIKTSHFKTLILVLFLPFIASFISYINNLWDCIKDRKSLIEASMEQWKIESSMYSASFELQRMVAMQQQGCYKDFRCSISFSILLLLQNISLYITFHMKKPAQIWSIVTVVVKLIFAHIHVENHVLRTVASDRAGIFSVNDQLLSSRLCKCRNSVQPVRF